MRRKRTADSVCVSIMSITTVCAVLASLRVLPDRSQFFQYESISVGCAQQGISSDSTVMRNTSINTEECSKWWTGAKESYCLFDDLYYFDTGVYWCESANGDCRESVNITVTRGSVILESPALPVTVGDDVILRCTNKQSTFSDPTPGPHNFSTSNLKADFFKDDLLIGSCSSGSMTIRSVSKSDEGLYKCNITGVGQSPDSWLSVQGRPGVADSSEARFLLPVGVTCFLLITVIFVMLFFIWRKLRGKMDADVPYTDIIITEGVQPNRITDVSVVPTFYSTVKL